MTRTIKKRPCILIAASCYLVYASIFSYNSSLSRYLSTSAKISDGLEYVHITSCGGSVVEKSGADANINWGGCHFVKNDALGCMSPDRNYEGHYSSNFLLNNIWQTPPKYLLQFDDENNNPYKGIELFSVVRNPYTRLVSEYYRDNGHKEDKDDEARKLNEWIVGKLDQMTNMMAEMQISLDQGKSIMDIETPQLLNEKRFLPQTTYVYDDGGDRVIDNLIHYENFDDEFTTLMDKYNLDVPLRSSVEEITGTLSYENLYPVTISRINKFYQSDFEGLGYESSKGFQTGDYSVNALKLPCYTLDVNGDSKDCVRPVHHCPAPAAKKRFSTLTDVVNIMDDLECPYHLHAGSVLGLVRDCEMSDSDIDIVIPLVWWRAHEEDLDAAFIKAGFEIHLTYGTLDEPGYESSYKKRGVTVDLFSIVEDQDGYTYNLWPANRKIDCTTVRDSVEYGLYGDLLLRVPYPFEPYLESFYGKDWRLPFPGTWRWLYHAVTIGNCEM